MKSAKDVMTPNPHIVQSGDELRSTIAKFFREHIHFAPVLTPNGDILGLVSEISLIKASLRNYLDTGKHEIIYAHRDLLEIADFVSEEDSIDDVVKALMHSSTRRLLVTNMQGALTGIISPKDILRLLYGEREKVFDMHKELKDVQQQSQTLQKQLKDLESVVNTYRGVFENSPSMMHSVDSGAKIIMANKKIHQMLGYEPNELLGMSLKDLYPNSVYPLAIQALEEIKEKGSHQSTYSTMLKKDGSKIRVDIASSALSDKYGKFIATISISREVQSETLLRALNGIREEPEDSTKKP